MLRLEGPRVRLLVRVVVASAAVGLLVVRSWTIDFPYSIDFQTYWLAGTRVAAGQASALYDAGGGPSQGIPLELRAGEFKNLPIVSAVFVPFAYLDYLDAKRVFWWIALASLVASAWLATRDRDGFLECLALLAVMDPAHVSLRHGQTTPLVLALLTGYLATSRVARAPLAGALLGWACLVKFPPLALLAAETLRGRLRMMVAAIVTISAAVAVSLALFGPSLHAAYLHGVAENAGTVMTGHNNQSLLAVITRFLTPSPALDWTPRAALPAARLAALAIAAALATVLAVTIRRAQGRLPGATYTAALALGLVALPVAWDHYFLLLGPGIYLLSHELREEGLLRRPSWLLPLALGTIAVAAPTPHRLVESADRLGRLAAPGLAIECAGALVLFAVAIGAMHRARAVPCGPPGFDEPSVS